MRIQTKAINTELTDTVQTYVDEKVGKLTKYLSPTQDEAAVAQVNLIYAGNHTDDATDECRITIDGLGKGTMIHAEAQEPEMHVAIDACVAKLEHELGDLKDKARDHISAEKADAKYVAPEIMMETEPIEEVDESDEIPPSLRGEQS